MIVAIMDSYSRLFFKQFEKLSRHLLFLINGLMQLRNNKPMK